MLSEKKPVTKDYYYKSVETERSGNGVITGDKGGMTTNGYGIWGKAYEKF